MMAFGIRMGSLAMAAVLAAMGGIRGAGAAIIYTPSDGAIPLSNLIGTGNSILVGDKIFDNFSYSTTGADMPAEGSVNITGEMMTVNGTPMWGIHVGGNFGDTNSAGASDAILRYDVTVNDPSVELITGATIMGNPVVSGAGNLQVTETWTPDEGTSKIQVYDIEPGDATQMNDSVTFDTPIDSLSVTKDILASVVDGSQGNASITSIDQLYAQQPTTGNGTPEPASLGILGLGVMGLIARRRR
jgi:hypothetical protein